MLLPSALERPRADASYGALAPRPPPRAVHFQRSQRAARGARRTGPACAVAEGDPPVVQLPHRMNTVPHPRELRQFFYHDVSEAVKTCLRRGGSHRLQVRCTIPELNTEQDVYRIGTLLEMVRSLATELAADGKVVKVCVQQSLGEGVFQGMPLSLAGVKQILRAMDWGDAADFIRYGEVGPDEVDEECGYYILISPQNVVAGCIMTSLLDMVDAVEAAGKHIILVNPQLKDVPSSGGLMGIRGRKERGDFAASFCPAYHFRLLYLSSARMYPIRGALRYVHGGRWQVFKREEVQRREEVYRLVGEFDEQPDGRLITPLFKEQPQLPPPKAPRKNFWW